MKIPVLYQELAEQFEGRNRLQMELFGKAHRLTPVRDLTVWALAGANVRVLYRNSRGQVYVDAVLALESLGLPWEDREWVVEGIIREVLDVLEVMTFTRGLHSALLIEIRTLARILGDVLDEEPCPGPTRAIWARSWETDPRLSDREAVVEEPSRS